MDGTRCVTKLVLYGPREGSWSGRELRAGLSLARATVHCWSMCSHMSSRASQLCAPLSLFEREQGGGAESLWAPHVACLTLLNHPTGALFTISPSIPHMLCHCYSMYLLGINLTHHPSQPVDPAPAPHFSCLGPHVPSMGRPLLHSQYSRTQPNPPYPSSNLATGPQAAHPGLCPPGSPMFTRPASPTGRVLENIVQMCPPLS